MRLWSSSLSRTSARPPQFVALAYGFADIALSTRANELGAEVLLAISRD